jgi:5'-methylthioadenosine phosphorylase
MAHPVCNRLGEHLELAAKNSDIEVVRGGTYLVMEGPQFSSVAESKLYRSWNCDVIGMTNMPEAKLAREAEMCYATVAMVTDYDCWHPDHDNVTVDAIIKVLLANADNARSLVKDVASSVDSDKHGVTCTCKTALDNAIITAPDARDKNTVNKLSAIAGRVLNQ